MPPLAPSSTSPAVETDWDAFFSPEGEKAPLFEVRPSSETSGVRQVDAPHRVDGERAVKKIRARIQDVSAEPQNEVQARYDKITMDAYEVELRESQRLLLLMKARLESQNIPADRQQDYINGLVSLRDEKREAGEPTFGALVTAYKKSRKKLEERRAVYEEAGKRLQVFLDEAPKPSKTYVKKEAVKASPAIEVVKEAMEAVYQELLQKKELTLDDAKALHLSVARALQSASFPSPDHGRRSVMDHRALLCLRYAYEAIEKRLDEVRVREMRGIEPLARSTHLSIAAGQADAEAKTALLRDALKKLGDLYALDRGSDAENILERRIDYHLAHANLLLSREFTPPNASTDLKDRLHGIQERVRALHGLAYPHGPCLSAVPLEAYRARS